MKEKGLIKALFMFIISLVTLSVSVFAWFAVSQQANIGQIIGQTADYSAILVFKVKKNGEANWTEIETISEMHQFFGNTVPSDVIHFEVDIENDGNKDLLIDLMIRNLYSEVSFIGFDMLDVYYLKDGLITVKDNDPLVGDEIIPLYNEPNPTIVTKHDQELNIYRFSNLVDNNNNFIMLNKYNLVQGRSISVNFSIVYDENTTRKEYETGIFHLNSFYVYLN